MSAIFAINTSSHDMNSLKKVSNIFQWISIDLMDCDFYRNLRKNDLKLYDSCQSVDHSFFSFFPIIPVSILAMIEHSIKNAKNVNISISGSTTILDLEKE